MKERHIIFSGESVRAIREGRKTQTRRVVKPQPRNHTYDYIDGDWVCWTQGKCWLCDFPEVSSPYGKPGDRLWVKETTIIAPPNFCDDHDCNAVDNNGNHRVVQYLATNPNRDAANDYGLTCATPSMYMPRWASRITLEIVDIRIERVQDISESDARAEGCPWSDGEPINGFATSLVVDAKDEYRHVWDKLNAERGFSWDSNPWVWVIEFKILEDRTERIRWYKA